VAKSKKIWHPRKRRTRSHVIEDISINFAERQVLLCNFALLKEESDYGTDLYIKTFDAKGLVESGQIRVQMKASDSVKYDAKGNIEFSLDTRDLNVWIQEYDPVLFVVYDASSAKAYYLHIQDFWKRLKMSPTSSKVKQKSIKVTIPNRNKLNPTHVQRLSTVKNRNYTSGNFFN
jgi:hypothetical protein